MTSKFTRAPVRPQSMDEFLSMTDKEPAAPEKKKQATQVFNLRLPVNLWENLNAISNKTGIPMHSICLNILHNGLKEYEK